MSLAALHDNGNGETNQQLPSTFDTLRQAASVVLRLAGSLWVTVITFSLALVLVFFGTLAQVEMGVWTAVQKYFRSQGFVWLPLRLLGYIPGLDAWPALRQVDWAVPFPGGWLLGWVLLVNLLAGMITQFRRSWRSVGVWFLHGGIILLMLGELITGLTAIEYSMTLQVGERTNFLENNLRWEMAFTRTVSNGVEETAVIPHRYWLVLDLAEPQRIAHPDLPCDVEVVQAWKNSILQPASRPESPRLGYAQDLNGRWHQIVPAPETPGVSPGDDFPAVHIRLWDKTNGQSLGEYVLSTWLDANSNRRLFAFAPIEMDIGGTTYEISLRRERVYLPCVFELNHFVHTTYPGSSIPKEFRSELLLFDEKDQEGRDVVIAMNRPLSYAGLTFYQSGYLPDNSGTILQVVRNPGWFLPYLGCGLVVVGMLVHFGIHLVGFVSRSRTNLVAADGKATPQSKGKARERSSGRNGFVGQKEEAPEIEWRLLQALPWLSGALAAIYLIMPWFPSGQVGEFDVQEFASLPVLQARIKPWDTIARASLLSLSGKQTFTDDQGRRLPAIVFLLDVISARPQAEHHRVFRIDNGEVLDFLGLQRRKENRYALADFRDRLEALLRRAHEAQRKPKEEQSVFDRQILRLANQLVLYQRLASLDSPELQARFDLGDEIRPIAPASGQIEDWKNYEVAQRDIRQALGRIWQTLPQEEVARARKDPRAMEQLIEKYKPQLQAVFEQAQSTGWRHFQNILDAWKQQNPRAFNSAVREYREFLAKTQPGWVLRKSALEAAFSRAEVFYHAALVYGLAFVLSCAGFLLYYFSPVWPKRLHRAVFGMLLAVFTVHTLGLVVRMYLQGRPPVTNLYSSAIFIGWAGAALGMVLERIYRMGIGSTVAAALGGLSLIIAHHLATEDTLAVLQAVLDTNFWLATHVTCITLGYTATFVAGKLAIGFIMAGLFTRALAQPIVVRILYGMMYGIVCFAILFSFTGTVLGGFWADFSWGRFWGWDPKENGALLIVLANALALHARWGGIVKQRGFALLCILGNIVTAWSWFGTNQMGIGLHSYGRMDGATFWLSTYWLSQIALLGIGLLPLRYWRSFAKSPTVD